MRIRCTTIDFTRLDTMEWQAQSTLPGLTIEGATHDGGSIHRSTADVAHWRYGGLGVKSEDDSGNFDGTEQLDTQGANDALVFRFDRAVRRFNQELRLYFTSVLLSNHTAQSRRNQNVDVQCQ